MINKKNREEIIADRRAYNERSHVYRNEKSGERKRSKFPTKVYKIYDSDGIKEIESHDIRHRKMLVLLAKMRKEKAGLEPVLTSEELNVLFPMKKK